MSEGTRSIDVSKQQGSEAKEPPVPIIGVGASAGGLEALREMFSSVKDRTGMAFVIVQHLDPDHESLMAQLIARETALRVTQVEGGEEPLPDQVYVIPPGKALALREGRLMLEPFDAPRGQRRPIDDFLISLAEERDQFAAGVILSGTGGDGAIGLRAIKEHGGLAIAQEPTSARYDGMPLSAVGTGMVDFVHEPSDIVEEARDYFERLKGSSIYNREASGIVGHIDNLCATLRDAVGHDFTGYKRSTLERRIARRMQVLGIEQASEYVDLLGADREECETLFRDLLINVTKFYRDTEHFDALRKGVVEPLVAAKERDTEIRVWVPGCSSGEEAYTIAMLLSAELEAQGKRADVQIFATDIDEAMLNIGREARYAPAALVDLPTDLRERYTVSHGDHFTVSPRIRDMVRFSNHSIIKDAPFSKLDFVSCRNLLIYFGDRLQQAVIPLLHYSIVPGGYLMLGPSETIGRFEDLFEPIDQKSRLFRRKSGRGTYPTHLATGHDHRAQRQVRRTRRMRHDRSWEDDAALKRLVDRYSPAAMVLDPNGEILASYGRLSRYFEFPNSQTGEVSATSLARPGLREVLVPLQHEVRLEHSRVVARDVEVRSEFGSQKINVIADPLPDGSYLFVFRETADFRAELDEDLVELGPNDGQVQILEDELRLARHRLRCTVEELETVNEELKSSNEEMMSMNEELQSTNEELTTVNDELKSKVDQLTIANADLKNFFESTRLAVVVLDGDLNIRSYTEAAEELFPLKPADRGRKLEEMTSELTSDRYLQDARAVCNGSSAIERQLYSRDGRAYLLRAMPYRVLDGSVSGVTLVFTDITEAQALEAELAQERERLKLALEVAGIGVWEYLVEEENTHLDEAVERMFGLEPADNHDISAVISAIHPDDRSRVEAALRRAMTGETDYHSTFRVLDPDGSIRTLRGLGRLVSGESPRRLVGVNFDITSEAEGNAMRELLLREMNHRVKNLFAVIGGLTSLAARSSQDVGEMARTLRERIAALGRAHSLTNASAEDGSDLGKLVGAALAPYADHDGLKIGGDAVKIRQNAVSGLALLLHEWATNSVKYGALADPEARLSVSWSLREDGGIGLFWEEKLSRTRNAAPHGGFGTTLVDVSARQLGATVEEESSERAFRLALNLPAACRPATTIESSS
ncbi:CheR family methyltransferase [Sphingomicrobium aestuariivivum]|uniref:CheR family methyltransferase n=1 Tax=Sphingomicrobium aestuariivivum TaxID=1582356 RepID=UPI001FD65619|nr:CheR family methyltransferase [Sphingomicrobium aestuariivivum]MCJ8191416.1 PAS domain-containing protein [Sphingomicrobium aestuariivivum]